MSRQPRQPDNLCPRCRLRPRQVSRTGRPQSYCPKCKSEVHRQWYQRRGQAAAKKQDNETVRPEVECVTPLAQQRLDKGPGFTARTRANEFALESGCDASFLLDVACDFIDGLGLEEEFQEDLLAAWAARENKKNRSQNEKLRRPKAPENRTV